MTKKHDLYAKEQECIRDQVEEIIGLQGVIQTLLLRDMDANIELHTSVMKLLPSIRDYFALSQKKSVSYPQHCLRPWLSIVKHLLKPRYDITSKIVKVQNKHTMKYHGMQRPNIVKAKLLPLRGWRFKFSMVYRLRSRIKTNNSTLPNPIYVNRSHNLCSLLTTFASDNGLSL